MPEPRTDAWSHPHWPPKLPPCRPFEPRRCAVSARAHEYVAEASEPLGGVRGYYRWAREDWSPPQKLALAGAIEAILCDLAALTHNVSAGAPRYLTIARAGVHEAQAVAPASVLAFFGDAFMYLVGCGLVDLTSHEYTPGGAGQLGFEARAELSEAISRFALEAHDFGCATLAERKVLRLP